MKMEPIPQDKRLLAEEEARRLREWCGLSRLVLIRGVAA
jgi:hypothetical protein